jgi:hypothetical protein
MTTARADTRTTDSTLRLRTTSDGVTVERALVPSGDLVGVWYRLTVGDRRRRVVRFTETLPEGVAHEDVGLHPDHQPGAWTRTADGLRFEATVSRRPTVTLYAVRGVESTPRTLAAPPSGLAVERTRRDR